MHLVQRKRSKMVTSAMPSYWMRRLKNWRSWRMKIAP